MAQGQAFECDLDGCDETAFVTGTDSWHMTPEGWVTVQLPKGSMLQAINPPPRTSREFCCLEHAIEGLRKMLEPKP